MKKAELLNAVAAKAEGVAKKDVAVVVDAVFSALRDAMCAGEHLSYPGFGTFSVKERAARDGRNPRTNQPIKIAASRTVGFKVAPKLKEALNGEKKDAKKVAAKKVDAKHADAKHADAKKCKK